YYELLDRRTQDERGAEVALVRLEQFHPFHEEAVRQVLGRYRKAREVVWVQEEAQNMGGWSFVEPRLGALDYDFQYIRRDASARRGTGSRQIRLNEQKELVEAAISGSAPHLVRATRTAAGANRLVGTSTIPEATGARRGGE